MERCEEEKEREGAGTVEETAVSNDSINIDEGNSDDIDEENRSISLPRGLIYSLFLYVLFMR